MNERSMITIFSTLLAASGLSLSEAAAYLKVSRKNIERWSSGVLMPPDGVVDEMSSLVFRQTKEVESQLSLMSKKVSKTAEISYPVDDVEAQTLGWPCVSAYKVVLGRIIAECDASIIIAPCGATIGTSVSVKQQRY